MKNGFIRHPWSAQKDSILASALVDAVETREGKMCGGHYEIFHKRVIDELDEILSGLGENEAQTLTKAAKLRGYRLDEESISATNVAYRETLLEIQKDQF